MRHRIAFERAGLPWSSALAAAYLALACAPPGPEGAAEDLGSIELPATYANLGRQSNQIRACFVLGPTPSPVTQASLDQIRSIIDEWSQGDTSLSFTWSSTLASMQSMTFGSDTYLTSCTRSASTGVFSEQFRIYVDHRSFPQWSSTQLPKDYPIPGKSCTARDGLGSQKEDENGNPIQNPVTKLWEVERGYLWSMFPEPMSANATCLYTSHLALGQPRNNYLHEMGHGLGLSHEQNRADAVCSPGSPAGIPMTAYDRNSPMHYVLVCPDGSTTPGNWGSDGLTSYDRLAIEVMYPQWLVSRVVGQLVGWSGGGRLWAASAWEMRGAFVSEVDGQGVLSDLVWSVDGSILSKSARPKASEWASVGVGRHSLTLRQQNLWGDVFSGTTVVEVLASRAAYDQRVAATFMPFQ